MKPFLKFPSISNFKEWDAHIKRNYCTRTFDRLEGTTPIFKHDAAKLHMVGTVKVHGTHGDVVVWPNGDVVAQSRNRIVTIFEDNNGFANWVHGTIGDDYWREMAGSLNAENTVIVFSFEWAGKGIQSVVGACELERFALAIGTTLIDDADQVEAKHGQIDVDGNPTQFNMTKRLLSHEYWLDDPEKRIFNVSQFAKFEFDVDFDPETGNIHEFVKWLEDTRDAVENDCPVARGIAKHDGVELEGNIGEGVVLIPWGGVDRYGAKTWLKFKGEKHGKGGQKVKKNIQTVDPVEAAKVAEFVQRTVTETRCRQGIDYLKEFNQEISMRNISKFIKWVMEDIKKEHEQDLLELGVSFRLVNKSVSATSVGWFKEFYTSFQ